MYILLLYPILLVLLLSIHFVFGFLMEREIVIPYGVLFDF